MTIQSNFPHLSTFSPQIINKNKYFVVFFLYLKLCYTVSEEKISEKPLSFMNNKEIWQTVLGEIELNISKANFITWFKNTDLLSKKEGIASIIVPNGFTKEWLENKYYKLILKTLRNISPDIKEIKFHVGSKNINTDLHSKTKKPKIDEEIKQFSFQEFEIDKETNLNPRYTFESFIIGSFNELAQAAAKSITKNLGSAYNPLFIYGGVGLGKTHLLQATGNEIINKYKNKKRVKYISSEKFTDELVESLANKKIDEFKNRYRQIDVLIIDDIQFLSGKEKTQEEFFHTFNTLYQKNKQIIISSDRPPKAIPTLEERLRSRFEGGMIADIGYPDLETRIAILKAKAAAKKIEIPEEILYYIGTHIEKNIRELEGALNRIIVYTQINNKMPSLKQANKILNKIISQPKKITTYSKILKIVSEFYDISRNDLINKCRKKEVVYPRQIAMYLMREELKCSYPYIGEKLGNRDHTTVMYACEKINQEIEQNESLNEEINLIRDRLYNH